MLTTARGTDSKIKNAKKTEVGRRESVVQPEKILLYRAYLSADFAFLSRVNRGVRLSLRYRLGLTHPVWSMARPPGKCLQTPVKTSKTCKPFVKWRGPLAAEVD
jgi:hypothetical protein